MPFDVGPLQLLILLVIILVVMGPKRLPQVGRSLGASLREFKNGITGRGAKDEDDPDEIEVGQGDDTRTKVG